MSYHGKQYATVEKVCACGCGQKFFPVPKYHPKSQGGGKWYPDYIRGHHPNNQKNAVNIAGWNRGMKVGDHPSLVKMGYQPGHPSYNDWTQVNERLRNDPDFKAKWIDSKRGKIPWNKGFGKDTVKCMLNQFAHRIYERDGFTCQHCGRVGSNSATTRALHCHHIVPIKVRPDLIFAESNAITLCPKCHRDAHNGSLPHLIKTD